MGNELDHGLHARVTAPRENGFGVVELRRYTVVPGRRDDLISLFEREFIESQEQCGMVPVGHYREIGNPDTFIWFRGFADMDRRRSALEAFYLQSPAWLQNRDAANATLIDSDNVLLLRPARPASGFDLSGLPRRSQTETANGSCVAAAIFMLADPASREILDRFGENALAAAAQDARRIAWFITEERANDFPRLPVRENERALVVTGICEDEEQAERWLDALENAMPPQLRTALLHIERLRLQPCARAIYQ